MKKLTLAAAVVASMAAFSAQATDIQMYGRVDGGLKLTHHDGETSLTQNAGGRAHNRFGFNIKEDLGNGMAVKVYLENGFELDTGNLDDEGVLFNRRSILALAGSWGEVGVGRMGTVQSTMAPYSMGLIKFDPFGTSYGQASVGTTFANTSRVNNGITWISPTFNGWKVGATYSLGNSVDDEEWVEYTDRDHTLALATDFTSENLYLNFTFANVAWGNIGQTLDSKTQQIKDASMDKDAFLYGTGGWWRFTPAAKLYWGAQYQKNWSSAAGLSVTKLSMPEDQKNDMKGGFDGYSLLLGTDYVFGQHKLIGGVQYFDGELSNNSNIDYHLTVLAAAYEYKFAKTVWGYVAATHSFGGGTAEKIYSKKDFTRDTSELFVGINWNW